MIDQRRLEKIVARTLPERAKVTLGHLYNKGRTLRANHEFDPPDVSTSPTADAPRHVVVIVVDALRYDYLTPEIAPFLAEQNPESVIAPSTWTFPSISSLATGMYPHEHGAMRQSDNANEVDELRVPVLSPDVTTLPEIMGGAGFETFGAFGFDIPFLALRSRFRHHRLYQNPNAETIFQSHRQWLTQREDRQTFSYLHISDLHTPHHPPEQYASDFEVDLSINDIDTWRFTEATNSSPEADRYQEHKKRMYRACLGYTDDAVSRYYERLKSEFGSDLSVVVTGDHGEGFWDHASFDAEHFQDSRPAYCVGHGGTPYECVTRVPLWMDEIDTSTSGLGSLIDLAPTILNQFGLEDELQTTGKPLSESVSPERIVVTEGARYGHEKKAVYRNGWKIIRSHGDETTVEFEVDEEPETTTIPSGERRAMIEAFPPWPDGQSSKERHVSRAVENRLRDLGYQ